MPSPPPFAGELMIDSLLAPGGARIGMVHMPGRNHVDARGRRWSRELAADLHAIERWRATALVTLVETHEFAPLGVVDFARAASGARFEWFHLPIPDMKPPGASFVDAWQQHGEALLARLETGERIVVHCAGGLGRTGTLVASLLVGRGIAPLTAISAVRAARPGAIETPEQERYVSAGSGLRRR